MTNTEEDEDLDLGKDEPLILDQPNTPPPVRQWWELPASPKHAASNNPGTPRHT